MEKMNEGSRKLLQLIQRQAGISRRKAQELIAAGEVSVNGEVVTDPFLPVDPAAVRILTLRGHPLALAEPEARIYRYYKPPGVLCSHDDPFYGNTVGRILRTEGFIGYTWVGRLDQDAEGLLLLTNSGDLVHAFTHPRYEVKKVYRVSVKRLPERSKLSSILDEMRRGIVDAGERLRAISARFDRKGGWVEVTLTEGKKHEIKRLFDHFGLEVSRLVRVAIGPIGLDDLRPGEMSRLPKEEMDGVLAFAQARLRGDP
jgi:23S rRNA pseudouridine2605 synthase